MKAFKWILISAVFCVSSTLFAAQSDSIIVSHYDTLQRLNVRPENNALGQSLTETVAVRLSFDGLGRSFDLNLQPNFRFLSPAARNALPQGIGVFRGHLADNEDSWARIVVYDDMPRGFIWDGKQMYAIEAPGDNTINSSSPVIYRLADMIVLPGTMSCGSDTLSGNGAAIYGKLVSELSASAAQGPGAVSEIDVGAVGDFEFTAAYGGDLLAAAAITDRMNRVDGIYSQEIGVQINVPLVETYNDPADPFTDESDASLLLDELATYRSNTPAQDSLGLTHLWTGRDLDGTTVGIAYSDVLCLSGFGAGLSEGNGLAAFDSLIAAHEIGHNFGSPHDGVPGACESEPQTFIMAPMLNGSNQFSQCTKDIIQTNAAEAACVTPLPAVDMTVELNNQPSTVLLGANTVLTYGVPNNGSLQATNVVADFSIPSNLTIESTSTSIGSCTEGAGMVNCALGDVPGLSNNTVTITTTPTTVGTGTLDATIAADVDDRPQNDQHSMQLTVDPAVDLVINSPSSVTVNLDQAATITSTLENRAVMDATGVTLAISFGSGVRPDNASWSIGACTVTAQQVDCQAANFGNQSNSTLTIGVTGLSAGAQNYTATMASNEADADPTNNTVNGTVSVNDPARESSGGAIGLPFLCLLGLAAVMRRRRLIFA